MSARRSRGPDHGSLEPVAVGEELAADGPELETSRDPASALRNGARWADGYLLANNAEATVQSPPQELAFNRSGGSMVITKPAGTTGRYVATFRGLSALLGTKSTVHVTGFGYDPTYCKPVGARLVRDSVEVRCFSTRTGAPANTRFTLVVTRDYPNRAFAFAHQPTAIEYSPTASGSWNPGGTIKVTRTNPGEYRVVFNGITRHFPINTLGHLQVNAVGTGGAHCKVYNWGTDGESPNLLVDVRCYTRAGAPADTKFTVLFVLPAPHVAYAWADKPSTASYSPFAYYSSNPSLEATTTTRSTVGKYTVSWTAVEPEIVDIGDVQVTTYGSGSTQCKAVELTYYGEVVVNCFGPDGIYRDSRFTVLLHS
ncbi:MAG: hypothetical protein H0V43_05745 [Gemmatimonadales bacterium]|nr:hypothetical protein [Gemmatimonadales bacterium]